MLEIFTNSSLLIACACMAVAGVLGEYKQWKRNKLSRIRLVREFKRIDRAYGIKGKVYKY